MREWMTQEQADQFLSAGKEGVLALAGGEFPYAVPLNYVYHNEKIYFHCGAGKGEKLERLARDPHVCFTVFSTEGFRYDTAAPAACNIHTVYAGVVARGVARLVEDPAEKKEALYQLVRALAPAMAEKPISDAHLERTAVVEIVPVAVSGKMGR